VDKGVIKVVAQFIHQIGVQEIELVRKILYIGLEKKVIPNAVAHVDWMHVGLQMGEELLLNSPDMAFRVNVLSLLSHLIKRYPVEQSKHLAKTLLGRELRIPISIYQIETLKDLLQSAHILNQAFP